MGEQFAVEVERRRLVEAGRDDLATRVEQFAETCGDGGGFDVLSFEGTDDLVWWIEVKTTGLGKYFSFVMSANEVRCMEAFLERFCLYQAFEIRRGS
ncbi:protein NO VEIN domain-containing protein [Singulisphaera rosea]